MLEVFFVLGYDLNVQANDGDTVLHCMVKSNVNATTLKRCLHLNIFDLERRNNNSKRSYGIARESSPFEVVRLFEEQIKRDEQFPR